MIPTDISQFRIRHVLLAMLSFGVALGIGNLIPATGLPLLLIVGAFWVGMATMFAADLIDSGPIDNRHWISQVLSAIGATVVAIACIGGITILAALILALLSVGFVGFSWQPEVQ